MTRLPTPLAQIDRRIAEAGRIRLGIKSGKAMKSIETFRFTSPNREVIEQLAGLYGGTAKPWHDDRASPPNQFEVITNAKEIDVVLPPGSLSCWYELWSGGGVARRCDGEVCQLPVTTPGGWEMEEHPCLCTRNNLMECRAYTRLNVILPAVAFRGVWRLETKGWNAAHELPGMVDTIEMLAGRGQVVRARLGVEARTQQTKAGKRNFVVPTLTLADTIEELVAGQSNLRALGSVAPPPMAALPAFYDDPPAALDDPIIESDIVDAVVIGEDPQRDRLWEIAAQQHLDPDRLWQAVQLQIAKPGKGTPIERIDGCIAALEAGRLRVLGFNPDGSGIWKAT